MHLRLPIRRFVASSGFTVPELMIVVAVVAILTAIAGPSFSELIQKERAKSAAADLHASLSRTRSEAVKRNVNVTMTPKSNDWKNGWQVLDPTTSAVIEDHGSITGLTLTGPASVVFRSSGRLTASADVSFSITGTYSSATRYVCLDISGRPSVRTSSCPT